ncbi:hypothetical protein ACE6H2_016409 [Prunus campanulata]
MLSHSMFIFSVKKAPSPPNIHGCICIIVLVDYKSGKEIFCLAQNLKISTGTRSSKSKLPKDWEPAYAEN